MILNNQGDFMTRTFLKFVCFLSITLFSSFALATEEKYTIDPAHSFVVWRIDHLGFSKQMGKWPANGTILLDQGNPDKSKVDVTIQMNQLVTGNSELNKHLMGPMFFDESKYPAATFVSQKIKLISKDLAEIMGDLTLHGVTKSVKLDTKLNKLGKNMINDKPSVGFSADAVIHRSQFGVKGFLPMVGDQVNLLIDVEAQKDSK